MKNIIGVYSQLPWGSEEELYEDLVHNQLKPLLTMLYQNPDYRLVMRLGLNELEYLDLKHPEMIMLINDLCRKNQIEHLCSCGFDSVLSLVPVHERSFHLENCITLLRKKFQKKIKGLWLYNQCFTPSIISTMDNCGLEFVIISSFNQVYNNSIDNRPFFMDELGKKTIVFPSDDKFSKEIADFSKTKELDSLLNSIGRLVSSLPNTVNTLMLNMDQLLGNSRSSEIYDIIFSKVGKNTVLPSVYISENEITRVNYLPAGIYGRDFNCQKNLSVNQFIFNNPNLYCRFNLLNMLRESFKNLKKNADDRNRIESSLYKCSNSSIYFSDNIANSKVRAHLDTLLNETEKSLNELNLIPEHYTFDCDRYRKEIGFQKNFICYLNQKGGSVSRLNLLFAKWNVADINGLFLDSFKCKPNEKNTDLSAKKYEITAIDKKRQDFIAKAPTFEISKKQINLTKHYKLRQNTLVVDIEVENLGDEAIKDLIYETEMNLSLPLPLNKEESSSSDSVYIRDPDMGFNLSLYFNEILNVSCKDIYQIVNTPIAEKSFYQYTQLKIQKNINVQAQGVSHTVISLKFDKQK